jgi:hypothetical protein
MYEMLLYSHSITRWLVLISLISATFRAYKGYATHAEFSKTDNMFRHWTATFAHIQLLIGMILYFQSPITGYFWKNFKEAIRNLDATFFSLIHIFLMLTTIIIITIGSAMAKRRKTDILKHQTVFYWFSIALIILLIAIPWPFSPLATRPYFR